MDVHVPGISLDDITVLNSVLIAVGAAAKSLADLTTIKAVHQIARYFNETPNFTNQSLAHFMGTDVQYVSILTGIAGGTNSLVEGIMWADSIEPLLPHRNDPAATYPSIFIVFSVITTLVLLLRLYSRWIIVWEIKSYDWAIVAGFVFSFAWGLTAMIQQFIIGTARDVWDFSFDHIVLAQIFTFALAAILYPLGMLLIKTSLLLFYYELSQQRKFRLVIIGIFLFMLLSTLGGMFANIFSCRPVLYWRDYLRSKCTVQQTHLFIASGSLNVLTDVAVWLCPLPLVWKLQLSTRERLLAVFTFGLGTIACVASCFRLVAIKASLNFSSRDFSPSSISSWTIIELYLGIICSCAPFLRALVLRVIRRRQNRKEMKLKMLRLKPEISDGGNSSHSSSIRNGNHSCMPSATTLTHGSQAQNVRKHAFCTKKVLSKPVMVDRGTQTDTRAMRYNRSDRSNRSDNSTRYGRSRYDDNSVLYSGTYITVHASRSLWTDLPPTPPEKDYRQIVRETV